MRKRQYATLVEYMERTGTPANRLLETVKRRTGKTISQALFSMILRGSRRCSLVNAWPLHNVTGVPMEELTRWPRFTESDNSQADAKEGHVDSRT